MANKGNDPVAIWQTMIGEMEKGFNSFANQAMQTPEFSKAVNQAGSAAAGAQKQLGELMEKYRDLPMDLADAALVRVAERESLTEIFTLDRKHFSIYRPGRRRRFAIVQV